MGGGMCKDLVWAMRRSLVPSTFSMPPLERNYPLRYSVNKAKGRGGCLLRHCFQVVRCVARGIRLELEGLRLMQGLSGNGRSTVGKE